MSSRKYVVNFGLYVRLRVDWGIYVYYIYHYYEPDGVTAIRHFMDVMVHETERNLGVDVCKNFFLFSVVISAARR